MISGGFFIFCLLLMIGLRILVAKLTGKTEWGQVFIADFFKSAALISISGSRDATSRVATQFQPYPRVYQLWLALQNLSYLLPLILLLASPLFVFSDLLNFLNQQSAQENPPVWIFWMGMSDPAVLIGALFFGYVFRAVFRFSGLLLPFISVLVFTSKISISFAWALFLGELICVAIETLWARKGPESKYRALVTLSLAIAGLLFFPVIFFFTGPGFQFTGELRWIQWLGLVLTFLATETAVSMIFFHFYYQRTQKS